ncbi:NEDD8-activating enzyme E1 catalytic subunit isoform X2 [Coffea arabica]|uniref:NEDD8-activating enzyme E1 catalytic subunit n=1 Tax=Coffea arabica TaxID=13443 RepID=A0A6P6WLW9_COFAR|nr:NEDD8-activating enzyme E1 catalytic subunit-like isoform X2 [Coffea arabica]
MADSTAKSSRTRDLDKLLERRGPLVGANFLASSETISDIKEFLNVLVVGAGGLGCELLKDLALSGFQKLEVIDMDRIEVTNLNRQFLFRLEDVGKPKAEVAAKRVMERINGVEIRHHFCRIEDKPLEFYEKFNIIVLGLDSIEARSYINAVACGFLETPRTAAHCIEYAHLIKWDEVHSGKSFDPDNLDHMQWVYTEAAKRAELFGIQGVTYSLTQGVVKNIIPAIASTNAIISAACSLETLKIATGCSKLLSNYLTYNGVEGLHTKVTEFVRDKDCLVCGPGVLIELDASVTLKKFIDMLKDHPKLFLTGVSITYRGKNLYMRAPPVLEEMTRPNLDIQLFELMDRTPKDIIHVTGAAGKGEKKQSCLRKLRVVFKGLDGVTDLDMAGGA